MNAEILQQERAAQCAESAAQYAEWAAKLDQSGAVADALTEWRQAMLYYAEAWRLAEEFGTVPAALTRARAHACRYYGDALARQEQHPEAANVFQEAADLYGLLSTPADREHARECARKALADIAALRADPHNRLYLLTARYARQQQQLALQPDTWAQQANCCLHIAQIFLRRDRPQEAYARYEDALRLYQLAEQSETVQMSQAECHHRLGNLLANVLIDEPNNTMQALAHYDAAIALYTAHEALMQDQQENLALCVYARTDLQRRLEK